MEPKEARRAGTKRTMVRAFDEITPDLPGPIKIYLPGAPRKLDGFRRLGYMDRKKIATFCHASIMAPWPPTGKNFFGW